MGISPATASRYLAEASGVLAGHAPDLHQARNQVNEEGWGHVVGDGTVLSCDRLAEKTTRTQGKTPGMPVRPAASAATSTR